MKNITDSDIEKINQATIRNIISKIKAGKVPSKYERDLLEEAKTAGEVEEVPKDKYPKHTKSDKKMRAIIMDQFNLSDRKTYKWIDEFKHLKKAIGWPVYDVLSAIQDRKDSACGTGGPLIKYKQQLLEEQIRKFKIDNDTKAELLESKSGNDADHRERIQMMVDCVKGFRDDQTAKHPKQCEMIDKLCDDFLEVLRDCA